MTSVDQLEEWRRRLGLTTIAVFIREGEHMADLLIRFFRAIGWSEGSGPVPFTREELLELGFILRIRSWERSGLKPWIAPHLPPSADALEGLLARLGFVPGRASDPSDGVRLSHEVMIVAARQLAHNGPWELGADIAVLPPAGDGWLERVADFLWDNRRASSS